MGFNNSDLPGEIFLTPDQKEYNKIRKDQDMGRTLCIEDQIAEKLKDICDYRANFIVKFSYGHVEVQEIDLQDISNNASKHPTIFDKEKK